MRKFCCGLVESFSKESRFSQDEFGPSMCEPCFNPSIMDILMNPSLACVHQGTFDEHGDSDDIEDVDDNWNDDIQAIDLSNRQTSGTSQTKSDDSGDEAGKSPETRDSEGGTTEEKQVEGEPGAEEPDLEEVRRGA